MRLASSMLGERIHSQQSQQPYWMDLTIVHRMLNNSSLVTGSVKGFLMLIIVRSGCGAKHGVTTVRSNNHVKRKQQTHIIVYK